MSTFAGLFGLSGYPTLRQPRRQQLWARTGRFDAAADAAGEPWQRSLDIDRRGLARTLSRLRPEPFRRVTTALVEAPSVYILVMGQSYCAAYLLWYPLQLAEFSAYHEPATRPRHRPGPPR